MAEPNQAGSGDAPIHLPTVSSRQSGLVAKRFDAESLASVAVANAEILAAVLNYYGTPGTDGGNTSAILYFPPGRYELARPSSPLPSNLTELHCDFVVPKNVTLRFAVGATLVLMDLERSLPLIGPDVVSLRRRHLVPGRPEDVYKVTMEVQGTIEAGIQTIFDCVMTDLRDPRNHGVALGDEHAAGHVYFTRNNVAREVFPEWFGATTAGAQGDPPVAFVRRTTMALQEAIRVAHGRRKTLAYREVPGQGLGVIGELSEVFTPPDVSASPRTLRDVTLIDGSVLVGATRHAPGEASGRPNGRWKFDATYTQRPSIPITLTGTYVVDAELSIGYTLDESAGYVDSLDAPFPDWFHKPNTSGAVVRGVRSPGRQGAGAVAVRAASTFTTPPPVEHVLPLGQRDLVNSASLLAVRGAFGTTIEGITFDANFTAPRCVTLQVSGGGQSQSLRLADCALRSATWELLHMGGDRPRAVPGDVGPVKELYGNNLHWSGNQDLLNTQVTRCAFDTGSAEEQRARRVMAAPAGVMYRTGQSLSVEFSRCVFQGVASPMFHAWSLRFTLRECTFDTRHDGDVQGLTEGTDIFFDNPRNESADVTRSFSIKPAAAMIKNVTSRSPRFITTFIDERRGSPVHSAIQLINVVHVPALGATEPLRPAIYWAGTARVFGRLVLTGCRFVRPRAIPLPGDRVEPVLVDLVEGTGTLDVLEGVIEAARAAGSAQGHVIDLGNRVVAIGRSPELVVIRADGVDRLAAPPTSTDAERRRLLASRDLVDLPIVDRYEFVRL
ncbi:MAG: hypothetical protein U0324_43880 [Polyangiales bacterium]